MTVFNFQGQALKIFPGVHPNNVVWKNISISTWEKFIRRAILLAATLVILYLSFLIIRYIASQQSTIKREMIMVMLQDGVRSNNFLYIQLLSTIIGLVIAGINKLILVIMKYAVKFEKHEKVTRAQSSIAQKFS